MKALLSQRNINSTDGHGRTPLMYAVIGKQSKVSKCYENKQYACDNMVRAPLYIIGASPIFLICTQSRVCLHERHNKIIPMVIIWCSSKNDHNRTPGESF